MGFDKYFESGEQKQVKGHFANLVAVAKADGVVGEEEKALLAKISKRFHITPEEFEAILNGETTYAFNPPVMKEDRYTRFINLIRVMMADSVIDYFEKRTLVRFAAGLSFNDEKVESLIDNTIKALEEGDTVDDIVEKYDAWLKA